MEIQETFAKDFYEHMLNDSARCALVVGDYRQIKDVKETGAKLTAIKQASDYQYFCADLTLQENRCLHYAFQFESLPAILFFDQFGTVTQVSYLSEENIEGHPSDNDYSHQTELLECALLFEKHDYKSLQDKLNKSPEASKTFYGRYLLTFAHEDCPDSSAFYMNQALEAYQKAPSQVLYPLYFELVNRFKPKATISFSTDTVDIGNVEKGISIDNVITVFNHGDTPLLFLSTAVSCSCISVQAPSVVAPYHSELIHITYSSGDTSGEIKQSVKLFTNTEHPTYSISIKGTIL